VVGAAIAVASTGTAVAQAAGQPYGFGVTNVPSAVSAGVHVKGGVSNGITGATDSDEGRGIVFAPGPDDNNWRWLEQWLPHSTWFLLAATAMTSAPGGQ